jgi:hypothetical protein
MVPTAGRRPGAPVQARLADGASSRAVSVPSTRTGRTLDLANYAGPMRRFPLAFVLVGVLALLAAGGALLGAFEAPTGADVAVHDAATDTLAASPLDGHYTASYLGADVVRFEFVAPDHATEVAGGPRGAVKARRSVSGSTATGILEPVHVLLTISGFIAHGSTYQGTKTLRDLVPASERAGVSGVYRTTVEVADGYVVGVDVDIAATEEGRRISERVSYHLTRIGSWRAS